MLDMTNLPKGSNTKVFKASGLFSSTVGNWQVWNKPLGCNFVYMFCLGSGAGGAGGATRASLAASIGAGGGGGGCSGFTRLLIPAAFVPDQLYVSVGVGPLGGIANAAGAIGLNSYISAIQGSTTAANLFLSANANNPAAPAAAGTTGAAGAAGTIAVQTAMQLSYPGIWSATVSIAGGAGSVGAADAIAVTAMTTSMLCGGSGGGGLASGVDTNRAGGNITGAGVISTVAGGVASAGAGNPGFFYPKMLCASGGTGGGSSGPSGVGGKGGDGALGCGGGGGGAGVTGGQGGRGGDGLVIISAW